MSAIQIKNVPAELHQRLRERARRAGRSLSEYALGVLERDLAEPGTREWLERLMEDESVPDIATEDVLRAVDAGRAERDEQVLRAFSRRN